MGRGSGKTSATSDNLSAFARFKKSFREKKEAFAASQAKAKARRKAEAEERKGYYRARYKVFETETGWSWKIWAEAWDYHGITEYDTHLCWGMVPGKNQYRKSSSEDYPDQASAEAAAKEEALALKETLRLRRQAELAEAKTV